MSGRARERRDAAHERAADAEDVKVHVDRDRRARAIEGAILRERPRYRIRATARTEDAVPIRRKQLREMSTRARIAAVAARLMAEDGIDDFALAKRKAARLVGVAARESLPANAEIEQALHAYRALYQAEEHAERIAALRRLALQAMELLAPFHPYLTGPVLAGTAGPYAAIELELFPDNPKEVELFLLERRLAYETAEGRRFSGDRVHAVAELTLDWQGSPLRLSVFDRRDERVALRKTQAGRVPERAGITEVANLIGRDAASSP
ncbi:MAG: hypothetical protein N2653_02355 [Burkholderiales bacterium]|nr:hypothetical protein [Burkholderiales bacterium]